MKIRLANEEAAHRADACERHLDDKGLLGYACARNGRRLTDAAMEYIRKRMSALEEHGDDSGGGKSISPSSPGWAAFVADLEPFANLEVEAEIMTVPASEVIGRLSGREVLELDWMIEDEPKTE